MREFLPLKITGNTSLGSDSLQISAYFPLAQDLQRFWSLAFQDFPCTERCTFAEGSSSTSKRRAGRDEWLLIGPDLVNLLGPTVAFCNEGPFLVFREGYTQV